MSQKDVERFLDALAQKGTLSQEFAKVVSDFAKSKGYKVRVDEAAQFDVAQTPSAQDDLDHTDNMMTSQAMGEEDAPPFKGVSATLAVGEEDGTRRDSGRVTSAAVGEEDRVRSTQAVGEEDKPPKRKSPQTPRP